MAVEVAQWLRGIGLEQYAPAFADNDIDGSLLPELTAEDLVALGSRRSAIGAGCCRRSPCFAATCLRLIPMAHRRFPPRPSGGSFR